MCYVYCIILKYFIMYSSEWAYLLILKFYSSLGKYLIMVQTAANSCLLINGTVNLFFKYHCNAMLLHTL